MIFEIRRTSGDPVIHPKVVTEELYEPRIYKKRHLIEYQGKPWREAFLERGHIIEKEDDEYYYVKVLRIVTRVQLDTLTDFLNFIEEIKEEVIISGNSLEIYDSYRE
jgi:hypothetical protein